MKPSRLKLCSLQTMTAAKSKFDEHLAQCSEAIAIHEFLDGHGYSADFGLRFVWVASVSALDHYVTELIVEKSTEHFSNGGQLSAKLLSEVVSITSLVKINAMPAFHPQAILEFRAAVRSMVRFRTFQKADDVVDGLAYIWSEKHKWNKISASVGLSAKDARRKLNSICMRRDLIVHNADYNEATGDLTACCRVDAAEVVRYIADVVGAIDLHIQ
jgi:hypothetical protein